MKRGILMAQRNLMLAVAAAGVVTMPTVARASG